MLFITSGWQHYFKNHNEGLGTTYERFILHQYFEKIKRNYSVQNVVEVPSFGMTGISGINSMWWASHGAKVTIVDQNRERIDLIKRTWQEVSLSADFIYQPHDYTSLPFGNNSFDMSWNFASLWFVPKLEEFLKELAQVTKKVLFICVPNRSNLSYLVRFFLKKNSNMNLHIDNINPAKIREIMQKLKWQLEEQGFLDVPPWPDIAMKKEDLLQKIGLKRLVDTLNSKEGNYTCILDYFSGKNKDMDKEILKYAFLEDSPRIFKRFWAHHRYLIFTPK